MMRRLAAAGIAAAALVAGAGVTVGYGLSTGFDRAADRADLPDVIARFDPERELTRLRRRHVGFVFQAYHLVPELTGEENVLLPTRLPGSARGAPARGRALIERLGLNGAAARLPHELSGGEQQRLAVARALVHDPAVVLADEPTGNLDAEAGAAVLGLLRGAADDGRAVVLVTHDEAATSAADRVLRLVEGRLEP